MHVFYDYRTAYVQSGPEKIAQSLMHCHSATVSSRITWLSPKFSEKIAVYQSVQNFYQLVKYSLINSRNWIHFMNDVTVHVNMTPSTVEGQLPTLQTEKLLKKMIVAFPARQ